MAELLIRTQDRGDGKTFAGDVVAVQPDGWKWGLAECGASSHPFWRVVKAPGTPVSAFADMLDTSAVLFRRKFYAPEVVRALKETVALDVLNAARRVRAIDGRRL